MTKHDKNMLLDEMEKLRTYGVELLNEDTGEYEFKQAWLASDVRELIHENPENVCDCKKASLNYEAEYNRLLEELAKVTEEKLRWKSIVDELEAENCDMHTVIKTLEFVYSREFNL